MRSVRLEFSDNSSDKFWDGSCDGNIVRVCFGRMGTNGQNKEWTFASTEEARAHLDKVVKEKLRKGYHSVGDHIDESELDRQHSVNAAANATAPAALTTSSASISPREKKSKLVSPKQAAEAQSDAVAPSVDLGAPPAPVRILFKENQELYNFHNRTAPSERPQVPSLTESQVIMKYAAEVRLHQSFYRGEYEWFLGEFAKKEFWSKEEALTRFLCMCVYKTTANLYGNTLFIHPNTGSEMNMRQTMIAKFDSLPKDGRISRSEAVKMIRDIGRDCLLSPTSERRMHHYEFTVPLMHLFSMPEFISIWREVWQIEPTSDPSGRGKPDVSYVLRAIRLLVLPYITDEELADLRGYLRAEMASTGWQPINSDDEIPICYILAGMFGMNDELLPLVESIPDNFYANQKEFLGLTRPQFLLFGLREPELVRKHFYRLGLTLAYHADCIAWLAHLGPTDLEPIRKFVHQQALPFLQHKRGKPVVEEYLSLLFMAQSPQAAREVFRLGQENLFRGYCYKWLENNPQFALAALYQEVKENTSLSQSAIRFIEDFSLKVKRERLDLESRSILDELTAKSLADRAALTEREKLPWLEELFQLHPIKKSPLPTWILGVVLEPVVIEGYCLSHDELVTLLLAMKASTPDEIHPLLLALREKAGRASFDKFVWNTFQRWLEAEGPSKEKWAMLGVGILAQESTVFKLLPLMKEWRGSGNAARAGYGLECIKAAGTDGSLMLIHKVSQSNSLKSLKNRAELIISEIAKQRNLSPFELEDRIVPSCGLGEDGAKVFDFGNRRFQFVLGTDMKAYVKDEQGRVKADLPTANKDDDADMASQAIIEWKELKKQVKAVAKAQARRLELAMISGRRWNAEEFAQFFLRHPLLWHICKPLIWATYGVDQKVISTFRITDERDLADSKEKAFHLPQGEDAKKVSLGLVHPLELDATTIAAWGQIVADYELIPPFPQLGRAIHEPTREDIEQNQFAVIKNVEIEPVYVPSVLEGHDWTRGDAQDGGVYLGHHKYFPGKDIFVSVSYDGIYMGDPRISENQKVQDVQFFKGRPENFSHWYSNSKIAVLQYSEVDPIVLSEVYSNLCVLASKGKKV